jgi:putative ABC transport system permease protein
VTRPAVWLAVRELVVRRRRVALAGAVIAALAATVMAMELVARAREEAVAAQIDAMGPALTVVPQGVSAGALARYELGEGALPADAEAAVRGALGGDLRSIERRLVVHREVAGARVPVVGVEAGVLPAGAQEQGSVALGSELARRLGGVSTVLVDGRELQVKGVMPSTASAEDVAIFMPLEAARALAGIDGANEVRLFLRAGVSPREAEARLARASLGAAVIRSARGDVADREAHQSLARHRGVGYAVMGAVAALCLLIAAHLDASERRVELATLVAIGASRWTVLGALLLRSALVAASGAALGAAGGAALAALQDPAVAAALARTWSLGVATVGAALVVGIVAAAPTALATLARDPVRELQES